MNPCCIHLEVYTIKKACTKPLILFYIIEREVQFLQHCHTNQIWLVMLTYKWEALSRLSTPLALYFYMEGLQLQMYTNTKEFIKDKYIITNKHVTNEVRYCLELLSFPTAQFNRPRDPKSPTRLIPNNLYLLTISNICTCFSLEPRQLFFLFRQTKP